jgi:MFS transporter
MLAQRAGLDRPRPPPQPAGNLGKRHVLTRSQQRHTVAACFLSWTLDAFDFFIMVFVLADIAKEFSTTMTAVTIAITLTLAARPLGALLFGYMADRIGRRRVLILNVLIFTIFEFVSGLAPSLVTFIVIRALFGVAMGGEWASAPRSRWNRSRPNGGAPPRGCCKLATPAAICSRRCCTGLRFQRSDGARSL